MKDEGLLKNKAAELRQDFDGSFAEEPHAASTQTEDLLSIRIDNDPYALRLTEIAGLFADRAITPLPGPAPELLGIAGIRGAMIPIYDLRRLLGYAGNGAPRWFVLTANATIGLSFDQFEAHLRLPHAAIVREERADTAIREVARNAQSILPIIHLPSVLGMIEKRGRG
jgi:chemotaxis signal transduction protein